MNSVKVSSVQLLEIVKKNRSGHRAIFLEAQVGFRKRVIDELERLLAQARDGKKVLGYVNVPAPSDHTKDYDLVVSMLEMSLDATVEITSRDYSRFVLDDWDWKREFLVSNSGYSARASEALDGVE